MNYAVPLESLKDVLSSSKSPKYLRRQRSWISAMYF